MAGNVTLKGHRVTLCPFDDPFWDVGLAWYNDPEIIALTSDDPNPLSESEFRRIIGVDLEAEQSILFGVANESGDPIGIALLRNIDPVHRGCDLHLTIGRRDHWGRGYGSEAIDLMVAHAFGVLGLHKVVSTPFALNTRMIRCLERCGFEREGLLRDALRSGNHYIDVAIMGRIDPDERDAR